MIILISYSSFQLICKIKDAVYMQYPAVFNKKTNAILNELKKLLTL